MEKDKEESEQKYEFPSQILYSSPPEASSLSDWVRNVENKRGRNGGDPPTKSEAD
jgi:hypothetical protein